MNISMLFLGLIIPPIVSIVSYRLRWYLIRRKIYISYVLHYARQTKQDTDFLIDACSFWPMKYIMFMIWKKNLRDFAYYPEIFDEVINFINEEQRSLAQKIIDLFNMMEEENKKRIEQKEQETNNKAIESDKNEKE